MPILFSALGGVLAAGGLWKFFISDLMQSTTDEKLVEPSKSNSRGALRSLKETLTRDDLELMNFDFRLKEGTKQISKKSLEKWTYNDVALAAEIAGLDSYFIDLVLANRLDGRVIKVISDKVRSSMHHLTQYSRKIVSKLPYQSLSFQELRTELGVEAFGDRKRFMIFVEDLREVYS